MRLHRQSGQSCGEKPLLSLLGSSGTFSKLDTRAQFPKVNRENSGAAGGTHLPTVQRGRGVHQLSRGCGCARQGRCASWFPTTGPAWVRSRTACSHLVLQRFATPSVTGVEKAVATHSSALAWRIPGTGSLVGCRLWGCTESDTTEAT